MNINTHTVISASVAAFRHNGNKIDDTNRNLVWGILNKRDDAIVVLEEDKHMATEIIADVQHRGMLADIKGATVSEFRQRITDCMNKEKVSRSDVGRLLWMPKVYLDYKKSDEYHHEFAVLAFGSKYIGNVKDKIEINFIPITVRFTINYGVWRHTGHDGNGNLVGFLNKEKIDVPTIIKGNVKSHDHSKHTNGKTTYLNYVKVVKK